MSTTRAPRRVVVIGGGITGMAAAWQLQQTLGRDSYALLEAGDRWGGKIVSERVSGFGDVPFVVEHGPDAFLTRKPWAVALARELGLDSRIVGVDMRHNRTYVLNNSRPVPIPEGLRLLVPTRIGPFLRSPLFSPLGKLRVLLERLVPARRASGDETLASFVRRRLGTEALDRLGEPLLAGIYNGEPERQSMEATFPQFPAMEREHGGLLRAAKATHGGAGPSGEPPFISFIGGAQELVDALAAQLVGDLRLNAPATALEARASGGYRVHLGDGTAIEADGLVIATPAKIASQLIESLLLRAAEQLKAIRTAGIGSIAVAFHREDVPHPLDGFGLVIPSSEGRAIDGMTWSTSKWERPAPEGATLIRVFFGGPHTRRTMALNDDQLVALVRAELRAILGVDAAPLFWRVRRWPDGYPQYDLGHLDRLALIEAALPPDIRLAGSSYRGVGVPDCIRQGRDAANQLTALLPHQQESL